MHIVYECCSVFSAFGFFVALVPRYRSLLSFSVLFATWEIFRRPARFFSKNWTSDTRCCGAPKFLLKKGPFIVPYSSPAIVLSWLVRNMKLFFSESFLSPQKKTADIKLFVRNTAFSPDRLLFYIPSSLGLGADFSDFRIFRIFMMSHTRENALFFAECRFFVVETLLFFLQLSENCIKF